MGSQRECTRILGLEGFRVHNPMRRLLTTIVVCFNEGARVERTVANLRLTEADRVQRVGAARGHGRHVTFSARQYAVNGERRSFALLRPIVDIASQERVRTLILDAFAAFEGRTGGGR